jgi:hypothetical protein
MKEASELALLNLEDGAEAVNWHIEVIKTYPPKVKLKRPMRSRPLILLSR